MNKYLKNILGILTLLIPAIILLGFLLNNLTKKSFYPNSGTEKIEGISSRVKVYFDDYGVPHILASNEKDMYFAMGYLHARDRLWQMDLTRRIAEGRLSEIFGSATLDFDKLFRTIGIDKFASNQVNNVSPKTKEILDSYTKGVNEFIVTHNSKLPVEFDALNYKPEPWKPENSLMVVRMMGWELNLGWYADYVMGELINKFGLEKTAEIFPDTNIIIYKRKKTPEVDSLKDSLKTTSFNSNLESLKNISELGKNFFNYANGYRKYFNLDCSHIGSNCWVISSTKSETGKPILVNDPHLAFSAPSKWYEIHLKSSNQDVYGMSIPGAPCIAIGHNTSIAWGITNLMNDDLDFYILDKDYSNINGYKYKNQSLILDSTIEKISVKDSNEIELSVKKTRIGPVISNLNRMSFIDFENLDIYKNKILTFRWTGFENSDEINSFYKINTATNWDDFRNALKDFGVPALNFTYADTSGNIGYHAAGKIPISKSGNNINFPPLNGNDDWTGFVDFDKLPNTYNPKEGFIVTANTNPFDWLKEESKNKYYISYIWEPSSRFDRIKEILNGRNRLNTDEFKLLEMNYISPYARTITKYILEAFKNFPVSSERAKNILDQFKSWNGELNPQQSIGSIYEVIFCFLLKNIYFNKMGDDLFHDFLAIGNIPYRSTLLLLKSDDTESFWLPKKNEIIRKSVDEAIEFLETKFNNPDPGSWHWGEMHQVKFRHPLGIISSLDKTFNIGPFEVGGDQTTVNMSEYSLYDAIFKGTFDNQLGPSMRIITDLADISHSLTVNSTGQSGQPLHPNYSDQTRLWLYGNYKHTVMSESEMVDEKYNLLVLEP